MLFNSLGFIFLFVPITLLIFHWLCQFSNNSLKLSALIIASLIFYGWWEPAYLLLIVLSIVFNFSCASLLHRLERSSVFAKVVVSFGITVNLSALLWFKYANFLVDSSNNLLGTQWHLHIILLPLAISFFTFQQIAYLVDSYKHGDVKSGFLRYALFVTFFPQLIAGPIVHHKEMMPQFQKSVGGLKLENLVVGATVFFIGLFKKVIIADGVAPYSDTVFSLAAAGQTLSFFEAWTGALAYSLQLYFDFSGYSDMAIGLARLFGVRLPLNFNSPYRAVNIIDFWRRWHITLSRFLRDYLYIPLGGNRNGRSRTSVNLLLVMLLGGMWHGAGWTFLLWGGMHGIYLLVNHAWQAACNKYFSNFSFGILGKICAHAFTLLAVVVAWVLFRAESIHDAGQIYAGMFGLNGVALPAQWQYNHAGLVQTLSGLGVSFEPLINMGPLFTPLRDIAVLFSMPVQVDSVGTVTAFASLLVPIMFALFWPNTQQIMSGANSLSETAYGAGAGQNAPAYLLWRPNITFAVITAVMAAYASFGGNGVSQFLYFQF